MIFCGVFVCVFQHEKVEMHENRDYFVGNAAEEVTITFPVKHLRRRTLESFLMAFLDKEKREKKNEVRATIRATI